LGFIMDAIIKLGSVTTMINQDGNVF